MDIAHTCGEHGIQKQDPAVGDIIGKLVIEQLRLAGVFISLDKDFANSNGAAAVSQALFHSFTCSHDGDAAYLALELYSCIRSTHWCCDGTLDGRKVVESFFDKQTDDAIRVENEVSPYRVLISYHTMICLCLETESGQT